MYILISFGSLSDVGTDEEVILTMKRVRRGRWKSDPDQGGWCRVVHMTEVVKINY